jgi:nitronate monooxygenase
MDSIRTPLTRMLGIRYPIICAPMFLVSYEALVIATAEAGALGSFPLPNYRTLDDLKVALQRIRAATDAPIGVNIHLSGKFPWQEQLALCLKAGVNFFITSLGDPSLITADVHRTGGKVFADVISLRQGLKARDKGVDGLIAVGAGAGGHGGVTNTLVLVPYLVEKTGLPVVAAGGISTGSQLAAAIAVGACGAISGTRFVATPEAVASEDYKKAVLNAGPDDIVVTDRITGNRASWIGSSIEDVASGPQLGSRKWLDLWSAGQSVAQTESIRPAGDVVREMVTEYRQALKLLQATVSAE